MSTEIDKIEDGYNFALTPAEALEAMEATYALRHPLMLWGAPGIGKSQIAKQFADQNFPLLKDNIEKLAQMLERAENAESESQKQSLMNEYNTFKSTLLDQDTNFIDFRLSQVAPEDLRGMPFPTKVYFDMKGKLILESELHNHKNYKTETVMVWASASEFVLPDDWKGLILFDEINSAIPIIQAASYQLILDKRIGKLTLPEDAFIVAAGNRETDGGVTFTLATPLRDRFTHIEVIPNHIQWIDDYAIPNKLNPATIAYVKETGGTNFNTLRPNSKSLAGGSSPRSFAFVSEQQYLYDKGLIREKVFKAMVAGRLGNEIAIDYVNYIKNMSGLPSVDDILAGEVKVLEPEQKELSKSYFIALNLTYRIMSMFDKKKTKDITQEFWNKSVENYMQFMDVNFSDDQVELILYSLLLLSKHDVEISYTEAPHFKVLVQRYSSIIKRSRNLS